MRRLFLTKEFVPAPAGETPGQCPSGETIDRGEPSVLRRPDAKATGRSQFTEGRIANPSHYHSIQGTFPSAGRPRSGFQPVWQSTLRPRRSLVPNWHDIRQVAFQSAARIVNHATRLTTTDCEIHSYSVGRAGVLFQFPSGRTITISTSRPTCRVSGTRTSRSRFTTGF
jgi:hypothetical protein